MSVISTPCIDRRTLKPVEGEYFEFTSDEFIFLSDDNHLYFHRWPLMVFVNLPDDGMERFRQSFRLWLEQEYEMLCDRDYHFSVLGEGSLIDDYRSLCIWFHNMDQYVMLKLQYD
jgi:hypothetical protein